MTRTKRYIEFDKEPTISIYFLKGQCTSLFLRKGNRIKKMKLKST